MARTGTSAKKTAKKTATKTPAKKTATTPAKASGAKKAPAEKPAATKAPAEKKAPATKPAKKPATTSDAAAAKKLQVREGESAWTAKELGALRTELRTEVERLREEIELAESDLVDLMRDPLDGAGDDEADAGAKSYERDQEITLTNNARDVLASDLHALERMDDGTYGICESCGEPIGKLRLQAYPRASLCVACKSRQERR